MTTKDIIRSFVNGATKGKASSLTIEGDKLYNYNTVICERYHNKFLLNVTKYSMTTTKHQNELKRQIPSSLVIEQQNIRMGASSLV